MNKLNKIYKINKTNNKRPNLLHYIASKYKSKVPIQPGLTKYNWDTQTYVKYNFEQSLFTHGTNAEELITRVPVIEVEDDIVMCGGVNDISWGHPLEYITLNTRKPDIPQVCKYCGLKYIKKQNH